MIAMGKPFRFVSIFLLSLCIFISNAFAQVIEVNISPHLRGTRIYVGRNIAVLDREGTLRGRVDAKCETNEDGYCSVQVGRGTYKVIAVREGFHPAEVYVTVRGRANVELQLREMRE